MTLENTGIRRRALRRYVIFQIPDAAVCALVLWLLAYHGVISTTVGWALFALWIGKEAALFPLLRRAYEPSTPGGTEALIGSLGVVTSALDDNGFVRIGPELWRARRAPGAALAEVGATVRVEAVDGFTLVVAPVIGAALR